MRRFSAYLITSILLLGFFFSYLSVKKTFAVYALACAAADNGMQGEASIGSCRDPLHPPNDAAIVTGDNGITTCNYLASRYAITSPGLTATCENYCIYGAIPLDNYNCPPNQPLSSRLHSYCPRDPSMLNPAEGSCNYESAGDNFFAASYCCRYSTSTPTPTPTPTPTSTPTPTPTPTITPTPSSCSNFTSCTDCTANINCGWHGSPGSGTCEYGNSSCPAGYTQWYYDYACSNNSCPTPTPTAPPPGTCAVSLSSYSLTLIKGQTKTLKATIVPAVQYAVIFSLPKGNGVAKADPDTFSPYANPPNPCWGTCSTTITALAAGTLTGNVDAYGLADPFPYCGKQFSVTVANPPTPTPTPTPVFTISGNVFVDTNENQCKDYKDNSFCSDGTESNYPGSIFINLSLYLGDTMVSIDTTNTNSDGTYSFNNLLAGKYNVLFFSPEDPSYSFTYPNPLPLNSLPVKIGSGSVCNTYDAGAKGALCNQGSIINLNAGVTDIKNAWFQSVGADMRWDSGFNNPLPSANTYASIQGTGGMPGIIFSGKTDPVFGAGSASERKNNQFNWQVGSPSNPDIFTTSHSLIPTSYVFISETAEGSGITPTEITSLANITAHGIYKAGDLTVTADYTFPADQNFIILVNGNLTINAKITVPVGSTAVFSAKGDIRISDALGEAANSAISTIEGLYSADGNFITKDPNNVINPCTGSPDLRLNIAGTVVANAGRTGATFDNKRSLCGGNTANPSVTFIERPDFMLNYPSMVKQIPRTWQEVAP